MNYLTQLLIIFLIAIVTYWVADRLSPYVQSIVRDNPSRLPRVSGLLRRWFAYPQIIDRVFLVVGIAALIGLPVQSIHNYQSFNSYYEFIDSFDGPIRSLLNGAPLTSVGNFDRRFNPILAALVPLYAAWSDPQILLLLQSLGLAIAAFPIYWFARRRIGHLLAFTAAVAFLASSQVRLLNQAAFYEIKLAVPLLMFATFFLLRERHIPFLACLTVALLLKQEVSFIAIGFAAYIFFIQRKRALGLGLAASGAALAIFVIQFLYPWLSQGRVHPQFDERYAYLGHTLSEVFTSLILHPGVALEHILIPAKIDLILYLQTPLALLPLVGLEVTAISIPVWAYTLLSDLPVQFDVNGYYQAPFLPFLYFGTVIGLKRLLGTGKDNRRKIALCVMLVVSSQLYLPSTWLRIFDPSAFALDQHAVIGHQVLQQIPNSASVIAQMEMYIPLAAARKNPVGQFLPGFDYRGIDFLIGDSTRSYYNLYKTDWTHWRVSGYFEPVTEQDGYFLLKRKAIDSARQADTGWAVVGLVDSPNSFLQSMNISYGGDLTLLGYSLIPDKSVLGGNTLHLIIEWQAIREIREHYTILAQLVDEQGHIWAEDDHELLDGSRLTDGMKAGDILRDEYVMTLPRTMPPGTFRMTVGLWNQRGGKSLDAQDAQGTPLGIRPVIDSIQVARNSTPFPLAYLTMEQPLTADMGEVKLLGLTTLPSQVAPGDQIEIGLYWLAKTKPSGDDVVAVQLLDAQENVVLEQSSRPAAGAYPTTLWQPEEVLLDWHDLIVPAGFESKNYELRVILRDAVTQREIGNVKINSTP